MAQPVTHQDTQPPAETLAINHARACLKTIGETKHVQIKRDALETLLAALTRRAGGDAIPAGMKPWHGGDCPPADWDETKPVGYADWSTGVLPKNTSNLAWSGEGLLRITAYTPKPPAGGDAGTVEQSYRQGQIDMRDRAAAVCDERGAEEQEGYGLNRAAQNYFRARNAVRALEPAALALPAPVGEEKTLTHVIAQAKHNLRLTQGCMDCNATDERRWQDTITWLEGLA